MKDFVKNSAPSLLIAFVIILVWEFYLQIFSPQLGESIYNNGISMTKPDQELGYVLNPNTLDIHYNREFYPDYKIEYRVNEQGFRDAGIYGRSRPLGTIRILLLGDSFAFGVGNQYAKIWPVVMEKSLKKRGYDVEIIKAGVFGYDTRLEIKYMKKLYSRYRPNIVVINFMFNDLFTNMPLARTDEEERRKNIVAMELLSKYTDAKTSWLHVLAWTKKFILSNDYLYSSLYTMTARGKYFDPSSKQLQNKMAITKQLFMDGLSFLSETPTKLLVLSIPQNFQVVNTKKNVDVDYIDVEMSKFAERNGFDWVPVRGVLDAAYTKTGKDLYFRLDGHLNNFGNRVVGEYFASEMGKIFQKMWWKSRTVRINNREISNIS